MNKILTRRGQEYFEVLDRLHSKGYVTNEQWHLLSIKEQENTPRMTNRVIEDTLLEHGYSKGSPTEQKRYRLLWMKERGIADELVGENKVDQIKNLELDPVFGAVAALRKQLNEEAGLVIEEAAKKAEEKVAEVGAKNSELEARISNLQDKYNEIAVTHDELKNKAKSLEINLLETIKDKTHFEATLEAERVGFLKDKKQFEANLDNLNNKHDTLCGAKAKEIEDLHIKYKEEISLIREYSERQRHDHIAEIENLKVAKNKLEKELDKVKDLERKTNSANVELGQHFKRLEEENKNLQKENNVLVINSRNTEGLLSEARGELKQLRILLADQKEEYQNINKQLFDYKERVGRLEEQLQQTKTELIKKEMMTKIVKIGEEKE
jgi:chromosome segregation ATPase